MRKILFIVLVSLFSIPVFSQSAYEGTIEFSKKKQDAVIIDFPYPPEAAENALIKKMDALGYKAKEEKGLFNKDKGFRVYKSAFINDISSNSFDYIFKVERKSRKEKDESQIYMIIMKGSENVIRGFDSYSMGQAKNFLGSLLPGVEAADLELKISAQEDVVDKSEKKQKKLEDDMKDMEKKLKKLQDDIEQNKKDQEKQKEDIINQQKALELLRGKRKKD